MGDLDALTEPFGRTTDQTSTIRALSRPYARTTDQTALKRRSAPWMLRVRLAGVDGQHGGEGAAEREVVGLVHRFDEVLAYGGDVARSRFLE